MKKQIKNQYNYITSAIRYDKDCVDFELSEMDRILTHYIDMDLVDSIYSKYQLKTIRKLFNEFREGYKNGFYGMNGLKQIDVLLDIEFKDSILNALNGDKELYNELDGYLHDMALYMV